MLSILRNLMKKALLLLFVYPLWALDGTWESEINIRQKWLPSLLQEHIKETSNASINYKFGPKKIDIFLQSYDSDKKTKIKKIIKFRGTYAVTQRNSVRDRELYTTEIIGRTSSSDVTIDLTFDVDGDIMKIYEKNTYKCTLKKVSKNKDEGASCVFCLLRCPF